MQLINEPPVLPQAGDQHFAGQEDVPLTLNLLSKVTDPNGDVLKLVDVQGAANGTLSFAADGSVSYLGNKDWSGTETVTYTVDDGKGGVVTGTATFTIDAVADAPDLSVVRNGVNLALHAGLTDVDGSETLSLTVAGLQGGLGFDKGSYDAGSGLWTFASGDVGAAKFVPPAGGEVPGNLDILFSATAREANGEEASTTYRLLGQGANVVELDALPSAHQTVDAGAGFDTLVFSGVAELDLTALVSNSLRNFEKLDLSGPSSASKLTLSSKQVENITDTNKILYVTGDDTDEVSLTDKAEWTGQGLQVVDGVSYEVYQHGVAADVALLYVQSNLTML